MVDKMHVSNAIRVQQSLNAGGGRLSFRLVGLLGIWSYSTLVSIGNIGFKESDKPGVKMCCRTNYIRLDRNKTVNYRTKNQLCSCGQNAIAGQLT